MWKGFFGGISLTFPWCCWKKLTWVILLMETNVPVSWYLLKLTTLWNRVLTNDDNSVGNTWTSLFRRFTWCKTSKMRTISELVYKSRLDLKQINTSRHCLLLLRFFWAGRGLHLWTRVTTTFWMAHLYVVEANFLFKTQRVWEFARNFFNSNVEYLWLKKQWYSSTQSLYSFNWMVIVNLPSGARFFKVCSRHYHQHAYWCKHCCLSLLIV